MLKVAVTRAPPPHQHADFFVAAYQWREVTLPNAAPAAARDRGRQRATN